MKDARIFHVNVNCADLERSRRFYVDALGLDAVVRTTPATAQPGAAFGLDRARWDAWILVGANGYEGGAIDLLEWKEPRPVDAPPGSLVETGYQRIGVRVPDLDATAERVEALGGSVWGAPATHDLGDGATVRLVMANDPDGTALELVGATSTGLSFVAVNTVDLGHARAFYARVGFREIARFRSARDDAAHLRLEGVMALNEVMLDPPGGGDVKLVLVGFERPSARVTAIRAANTLGIWRVALLVRDLDDACAALADANVATLSEPVMMAMGHGLPELRFVCFRGPDGEVLELIEQPR
jgi:catechol 2,3-dioxygenase-like lactoylglutathione lyase family enzyme